MKSTTLNRLAAAVMALPLAFAMHGPAVAQVNECLTGRQIQQALDAGQIVQLNEAMRAAGIVDEPIGRASVCRQDGELKYRLNFMNRAGESETRDLPAEGG